MARITDEQRQRVLQLHTEGHSRNHIARTVGISAGSVTNICRDSDRSFDRSATKQATEAKSIDLAAGRIRLAEKMLAASEDMLDRIDQPYLVYNFGGKENDYNDHTLDSAPVEVRRSVIVTAGITFDKLTKILDNPRDKDGMAEGLSMLGALAQVLREAPDTYVPVSQQEVPE